MNSNIWFYSLSSIIQASASLLSLFAVFVVFKLDKINKEINDFENLVIPEIANATHDNPIDYAEMRSLELIKRIEKFINDGSEIDLRTNLGRILINKEDKKGLRYYKRLVNTKKTILKYLLYVIAIFLIIISGSIIILVWHSCREYLLWLSAGGFIIGLSILGVFVYRISAK